MQDWIVSSSSKIVKLTGLTSPQVKIRSSHVQMRDISTKGPLGKLSRNRKANIMKETLHKPTQSAMHYLRNVGSFGSKTLEGWVNRGTPKFFPWQGRIMAGHIGTEGLGLKLHKLRHVPIANAKSA